MPENTPKTVREAILERYSAVCEQLKPLLTAEQFALVPSPTEVKVSDLIFYVGFFSGTSDDFRPIATTWLTSNGIFLDARTFERGYPIVADFLRFLRDFR